MALAVGVLEENVGINIMVNPPEDFCYCRIPLDPYPQKPIGLFQNRILKRRFVERTCKYKDFLWLVVRARLCVYYLLRSKQHQH
jgi:hypothetical protein